VGNNNNSILRNMKTIFLKKTKIDLLGRKDGDLNINVINSCHLEDKEKSQGEIHYRPNKTET